MKILSFQTLFPLLPFLLSVHACDSQFFVARMSATLRLQFLVFVVVPLSHSIRLEASKKDISATPTSAGIPHQQLRGIILEGRSLNPLSSRQTAYYIHIHKMIFAMEDERQNFPSKLLARVRFWRSYSSEKISSARMQCAVCR